MNNRSLFLSEDTLEKNKIYIFNPDHDLALAHSDGRYDITQSAQKFACDCAVLPLWYAAPQSVVLAGSDEEWLSQVKNLFPVLANVGLQTEFGDKEYAPWGWNIHLKNHIEKLGAKRLPDDAFLQNVKRLSHRRLAAEALGYLKSCVEYPLPESPTECFSEQEVDSFVRQGLPLIFKAPWSGSGKGLFRLQDAVPHSFSGWIRNVLSRQRSVMAERYYDKKQDFAMEFVCAETGVSFAGYSLFSTSDRGAYVCNELLSDEMIEDRLKTFVPLEILSQIKVGLISFFERNVLPYYHGVLGVDMFVYKQDGTFFVHPCVEINVRMTMGMVARVFYGRFVQTGARGLLRVNFCKNAADLYMLHQQKTKEKPLSVVDGRIVCGYLSLCPILEHTNYSVSVEIG